MELIAGKLIPLLYLPDSELISKLELITAQKRIDGALISSIADPRLSKKKFEIILKNELCEFYKWMLKRAVLSSVIKTGIATFYKKIYVLLPTHATAIHFIRRALPFAALGIPVYCCFKPEVSKQSSVIIKKIVGWLGITKRITIVREDPRNILPQINSSENLVVVTGKAETISQIKSMYRKVKVLGAVGRCSILLTDSFLQANKLRRLFQAHFTEYSCTTLKATFILSSSFSKSGIVYPLNQHKKKYYFKKVLSKLHPSIIFLYSKKGINEGEINYCLKPISGYAQAENLEGLGSDPVYGWPGDYLL